MKKFTESQIVATLKKQEAGIPVKEICRELGISEATFFNWKSKHGGMQASDVKRLKELEAENAQCTDPCKTGQIFKNSLSVFCSSCY